jgi:hypothetical protein
MNEVTTEDQELVKLPVEAGEGETSQPEAPVGKEAPVEASNS